MEHPCHKCSASVEDGTPFCPRCSAPQIRVAGAESLTAAAAEPEDAIGQRASYDAPQVSSLAWPQALSSAAIPLLVAIFIVFVSKSAGLAMLAAGFLSVVLYRRRCPIAHITAGMGARLGALTGVLGFGLVATVLALGTAFSFGKEIHDATLNSIQQNAAQTSDPRVQQLLELAKTPQGFTFIMILILIVTLLVFVIFASLGGAIGAFLLHRKERP